MARQLRIGFSACFLPPKKSRRKVFNGRPLFYGELSMPSFLQRLGALTFLIPPNVDDPLANYEVYARDLDGLVLVGGVDVSPTHYGERAKRAAWRGDPDRDRYDMALFRAFLRLNKPILGICRGMQLINVALGGSLYQDISTQVEGSLVHRNADEYEKNHHAISVQKDGLFSALYGRQPDALVNSVHHQGIKKLAPGLRVEAISPVDGIIEAISLPRSPDDLYPNCFAVQWHPEFQDDKNPTFLNSQVLLTYFMQLLARQAQESAPQQQRTIVHA